MERCCSTTGASRPGFHPHKIAQGWSFQNCSMSMTSFVFSPRRLVGCFSSSSACLQLIISCFFPLAPAVFWVERKQTEKTPQTLLAWYIYYQILTPPLSGMAEHTLKLLFRWCNEGHAASGPQHTPTLRQQPQMGACLNSNEGGISILVTSIILSLMEINNMPFVHQTKAWDKLRLMPQLFYSYVCVCVCVQLSLDSSLSIPLVSTYSAWTTSLFPVIIMGRGACLHLTGLWCNLTAVCNMQWISGGMQHFH